MSFHEMLSFLLCFGKVIGFIVVLFIIRNSKSLNKDIPWIVLVLLCPCIGSLIYLILGSDLIKSNLLRDISKSIKDSQKYLVQDNDLSKEVLKSDNKALIYLSKQCKIPVTRRNDIVYYPSGEVFFENVKKELEKAQKFIFIEFFSIASGTLWDGILEILKVKVKEGVEVRIIYDNTVSKKKIPTKYYEDLEGMGIKCEPYYKKYPLWGMIKNHREHRKCVIVDEKIAFTGGVNIEDKYANLEEVYGYWKDVGISISGNGVWNFTVMFLSMWNALRGDDEDYCKYKGKLMKGRDGAGYVVSFGDNPLDQENVVKNVYISLINQAKDRICIFTPYLILDMDMYQALALAAKRGVVVKIIIPGIPDKKTVYQVSLMNARKLLEEGVKVYTYTPGFMHGKVFLVDDKVATVGTMNTDYRSLYLDFEYGVLVDGGEVIKEIKKDVVGVLQQSVEVKPVKVSCWKCLWEGFLQLFAPLM